LKIYSESDKRLREWQKVNKLFKNNECENSLLFIPQNNWFRIFCMELINKKWFDKEQKLKKMNKNKTDGLLNKNHKENKINNNKKIKSSKKESLKANKKNNSEKMITNRKETSNNINSDSIKNFKKRYKKSLTETIKDEKEKSEKGNDSESCIIEGDSEYGDSEAFKL